MCGGSEVVVFSPNRGCTIDVYCRKYTVSHWRVRRRAWQLSWVTSLIFQRSRRRSISSCGHRGSRCGGYRPPGIRGRASRVLQAEVLLWSRHGPRPRVAPMPIEGSAVEKV